MLFTPFSDSSICTAATGPSFDAPVTSTGMFGDTSLGFGLSFSGAYGAAAVASTIASTTTTTTVTTTTTTTATSSFTLNLKPLTSIGINNTVPVSITSIPFTPTVNMIIQSYCILFSAIITPVMTYGQLDGLVNKWNLELEDQEKYFLHQATLVNAWDYTLMENGEKITALHGEVEKVKLHQKRLEQELDFILSQQRELEDLFIPLEESLKDHSGSVYPQYIDEHEKTYKFAENVDAQMKQMTQDLKDIIEYLNIFESPADSTDLTDSLPAEPQGKPKNTGVDSLSLLQRIFSTQESNQGLFHCRQILYQLSYQGNPDSSGFDIYL
ncbi:nucleoporin-62 C-terminal-like protein isoform X1 [Bos javanicus]|uniref:nucleoporin-62 C-terminal-like protein isoform X1 n=1 Tax=Bos javanicus TaxID=9906 RepID=UPI002AA7D54A|nr:nucleoporin-62 C-terminal-like protein isoform X1 [Bos javanicus]XP_061265348.1 nucleoporin-62 C-terminal-like protein isoform X1 [Bos javanicus]XP_061265349.1 nucleoporin-62 C-terminal-like protein isoform X1 [Bos javanicus]